MTTNNRYHFTANALGRMNNLGLSTQEAILIMEGECSVSQVPLRDGMGVALSNGNYSFVVDDSRPGRRVVITVRKEARKRQP